MQEVNVLKHVKVLYVEDEPITRNQVNIFLKKRLGKVITAENGQDGIKKFNEHKPDVIITDLVMPEMNGIEMMRKIRGDGYRCPVIITSALSDSKIILETVDLKIEKYLIKPIDINELMKNLTEIAVEELELREDLLVVNHEFILTEDKKSELELEIRNLYSSYLKKMTGKGAKLIQVLIKGKQIEILVKQSLTTLEESFLISGNHYKSIEVIRRTIYQNTMDEIERQIGDLIKRKTLIKDIQISPKENYERLIFQIL